MVTVQFRHRVAKPNIPATAIPLPLGENYLVASLKGGAGITVLSALNTVWLTGIFGIAVDMANTSIDVSITRSFGAGPETTIYLQNIDLDPAIDDVVSIDHVDEPGAEGPVRYFLYVKVLVGDALLSRPVSFTGMQNTRE